MKMDTYELVKAKAAAAKKAAAKLAVTSTAVKNKALLAMAAIVLLGTVAAFSAYMEGIRCVGPKKGSLYASIEPVSAAVFSALLMGARFTGMDLLGFACILSTIFLLAMDKKD